MVTPDPFLEEGAYRSLVTRNSGSLTPSLFTSRLREASKAKSISQFICIQLSLRLLPAVSEETATSGASAIMRRSPGGSQTNIHTLGRGGRAWPSPATSVRPSGRWRLPARYLGRSRVAGRRRRLAGRLGSRRPGAKPREPRWRRPSVGRLSAAFFIACSANTVFASSTPSGWSPRRWWCEAASEPLGAFMALRSLWAAYRSPPPGSFEVPAFIPRAPVTWVRVTMRTSYKVARGSVADALYSWRRTLRMIRAARLH
ncbi:hypothetical protein MTO96_011805 [Rhipicephalus appendiculatus]